jgi:ring-1,2-phenylacetyl-CoA epoxidase subunit PaaE
MKQYTLTIQKIIKETKDSVTISLKQPILRKIRYQAGQYVTLIIRINGRKYARPYSLSSAPSVDSFLDITVKSIPGGIVSNYLNNELKVGDVLEVMEPMGDFTFKTSNLGKTIYLWCIGSGITPLFSLTKELLSIHPDTKIFLVYGNKLRESTIFYEQLLQLQKEYKSLLNLIFFYSQEKTLLNEENEIKGKISSDFVLNLVSSNNNCVESIHYICGPNGLKGAVKSALLELEVPLSSIFFEEFNLVIDPIEFDGIQDSNVTLYFHGKQSEIFVPKGRSIVDIALDNHIEIPYSCQTGNCNTCKAKLKKGRLKMIGLSKERKDLDHGEFLLCCSYPIENHISIEVI